MSEDGSGGPYRIADLVRRVRDEGVEALSVELGPYVLVGSSHAGEEDAWSFATHAVAPPTSAGAESAFDLSHGTAYPLRKRLTTFAGTILIGRSSSNDLRIEDGSVSKLHARARLDDDGFWLEDAGSRNGTFVEGERLATTEVAVYPGDTVRFGSVAFKVHRTDRFCDLLRRIRG